MLLLLLKTSLFNCYPTLEYASIVWDPYTKRNIEALEIIQRKSVRFIHSKYRRTDSPTNLMKENSIPTLEKRRKMHRLKFLFLLNNKKLSVNRDLYLKPLTTRQTRHRQAHSLPPYFAKTNIFMYSYFYRTINDWHCLPQSLKANCTQNFDLSKTVFSYSLVKKKTACKTQQLKYTRGRRERPA